jgi:hypothetical protein
LLCAFSKQMCGRSVVKSQLFAVELVAVSVQDL